MCAPQSVGYCHALLTTGHCIERPAYKLWVCGPTAPAIASETSAELVSHTRSPIKHKEATLPGFASLNL